MARAPATTPARSSEPRNPWANPILIPILTGVLTLAGVAFGSYTSAQSQNRQQDIRLVEIGLSILKGEITESSQPARAYAIELLKKYPGGVDLPAEVWSDWARSGSVPFGQLALGPNSAEEITAAFARTVRQRSAKTFVDYYDALSDSERDAKAIELGCSSVLACLERMEQQWLQEQATDDRVGDHY